MHSFNRGRLLLVARFLLAKMLVAFCLLSMNPVSANATDIILFLSDSPSDTDSLPEINLMRPDGSDHRRIRTNYPVSSASLGVDGQWIVYVTKARKELRLVHVSGKREKVLVRLSHSVGPKGPTDVKWSPNGRYVLYTRYYANNKIGLEVYDTLRRTFSARQILGPETVPRTGAQIVVRRLLWSPDSKTFALSVDQFRGSFDTVYGWLDYRYSFVHTRRTGKIIRSFRYLNSNRTDKEPFDYFSNSELLLFQTAPSNVMYLYNFRTGRERRLANLPALMEIYAMAVSPGGGFLAMDASHIADTNGEIFLHPWSSISGTPRNRPWRRNFATYSFGTKAAAFITPLDEYSNLTNFNIGVDLLVPNFEWRSVRSETAFRSATCWGWAVTMRGTPGPDRIIGTSGSDVIATGLGDDVILSGGGDDIICSGGGNDQVNAGPGQDIVFGDIDANQYNLSEIVQPGNDVLNGSSGNDAVYGFDGVDRVAGGAGNDYADGGGGNDVVDGGPGEDTVSGGAGRDSCRRYTVATLCE